MPEATPPNPRTFGPHVGVRIGHGYDLHRLEPLGQAGARDRLILGGIQIESDRVPVAHSDGDALLHAITDAILGALAMPDIGQLFPDTDPRHAGEDSSVYLREAARRAASAGWSIANLDATVVLERPKIGPYKEAMRTRIAELVGIAVDYVNVKGKTHERVDAVGEGRAVEVHVVALLTRA